MAASQAAGNAGGSPQHTPNHSGMDFEDAVRAETKARIALIGPSGSGKTYTGLSIATGMGGTIGVIDTERGSAANYAGLFTFKHLKMPNSAPQTLVQALAIAAERGIDIVLIDSLTHFWSGKSGILDQVDSTTNQSRSKNAYTTGWKAVKPIEQEMWEAVLSYPGHVITTIRAKTAYEIQTNDRGQKEPVKIGLKPEQRESADFEFDLVGDLDQQHIMTVSKSRYPGEGGIEVGEQIERPDTTLGQRIVSWLAEGVPLPTVQDYVDRAMAQDPALSYDQLLGLYTEVAQRGLLGAALFDPETKAQTSLERLIKRVGAVRKATEEAAAQLAQPAAPAAVVAQEPAAAAQVTADAPPQPPQDNNKQQAIAEFSEKAQRGWDSADATFQSIKEAEAKGLLLDQMVGPDGELHRIGDLLTGRLAELRSRQSATVAADNAASRVPNQQQKGAA